MELELSLREGPSRPFMAAEAAAEVPARGGSELGLEFRIGLGSGKEEEGGKERGSDGLPVQHNLLHLMLCPGPSSPRLGFPLAPETSNTNSSPRDFDMNQAPCAEEGTDNSANRSGGSGESGGVAAARRSSPRVSEEDNWPARKKLRLTREQSALLEQNFMQHNILNPKEKLALAKRLNLRPRQVEVWFQNRRARTKLKQREVEWYHLKRCWETLREENRRLQKELCALEMSPRPFSMNLPATALSTCPSCEGVGPTAAAATSGAVTTISMAPAATNTQSNSTAALFSGPRFYSPTTQEAEPPPQPPAV